MTDEVELLFVVNMKFREPLDDVRHDVFWHKIIPMVEKAGIGIAGMGGKLPISETTAYVMTLDDRSVTEQDRQVMESILNDCSEFIESYVVGPLINSDQE